MRMRVPAVVAMAFLLAVSFAGAAHAADPLVAANPDCFLCHASGGSAEAEVAFGVSAVDRSMVCARCHWEPAGSHPYHNIGWNCGSCHTGMGFFNAAAAPSVSTTYGWFNTASSAEADADTLHVVHSNPTWAGAITKNGRECASCHAAAACTVCHESVSVDPSHWDHTWDATAGAYAPGTGPNGTVYSRGTSVGNEGERTLTSGITCSDRTCHTPPSGASAPALTEDFDPAVTYSGAGWGRVNQSGYTGNSYSRSNAAGARAELVFTGERVELVSGRHPYFGKIRVYLDSVEVTTADLYAAAAVKQVVVYRSGQLSAGTHTIAVEVIREKDAAARDYYGQVDAFRVFPKVEVARAQCSDCHNPMATHGAVHETTSTYAAPVEFPGASGTGGVSYTIKCLSCHRTNLLANHGTDYTNCSMCHEPAGPRSSFGAWDKTCQTGACHPGSSAPHLPTTARHYHEMMSIGEQPTGMCQSCHGNPEGWQCGAPFGCHVNAVGPDTSVDHRAPSTTATRTGSDPIVWRLSATDIGDGVAATYYSFDGAPFALYGAAEEASGIVNPADVSAPYAHTLRYYSVDAAGNVEAIRTADYNVTDNTPPVVTFSGISQSGAQYAKSLDMLVADPKVNGLNTGVAFVHTEVKTFKTNWGWFPDQAFYQSMADFTYPLDGTWDVTRTIPAVEALAIAKSSPGFWPTYQDFGGGSGRFQFQYYARDYTGNQTPLLGAYVYIDNGAPVTTTSTAGVYRWRLNASDNLVGVASTSYSFDGAAFAVYTSADHSAGIANTEPGGGASGAHTLRYYSVDKLGNTEATKTLNYNIP